jgi:hypothetical protein
VVVSGASSVPRLTAAIVDVYLPCFAQLDAVDYANRGLATTSAVLSYVGNPMTMLRDGRMKNVSLHAPPQSTKTTQQIRRF